jgi:hypothetical protein
MRGPILAMVAACLAAVQVTSQSPTQQSDPQNPSQKPAQEVPKTAAKPDAQAIIRKSLERDFYNFNSVKDYTYIEREEDREYDGNGKLKKTESSTNEVLILAGRPYEKEIAKNDKPLPEHDARKEQEKMDKELVKREHMSASDRAKVEKEREEERAYLREIPDAFRFRLAGEENISGQPAWVIEAEPKPGYQVKDSKAKVLAKVRGKFWITQHDNRWVKIQAEAIEPLSFGLGLFRIAPGGAFTFEQKRVNDEVWLPTHILIRGDARLAYLKKVHGEIELTYRDYKKFQTDSKIVATEERHDR